MAVRVAPVVQPALTPTIKLLIAGLIAAVCLVVVLMLCLPPNIAAPFGDSTTYYVAGKAMLTGADPFVLAKDFRQWPLVATLWIPLAHLPQWVVIRFTTFLSVVAALGGLLLLQRRLRAEGGTVPAWWVPLAMLGAPTIALVFSGNMSGLCFGAFALGLTLLKRHPRLAGVTFACIGIKPHLALLALPALLGGPLEAGVTFALGSLVWPLGSLLFDGPARTWEFFQRLYAVHDTQVGLATISVGTLLPIHGPLHTALQAFSLAGLLFLLVWMLRARLRTGRPAAPYAVDAATALVLATLPYALVYDLLFTTPALLRQGSDTASRGYWLLFAWWALPWVAIAVAPLGLGGLLTLVPLALAYAAWRAGPSRPYTAPGGAERGQPVRADRPGLPTDAGVRP